MARDKYWIAMIGLAVSMVVLFIAVVNGNIALLFFVLAGVVGLASLTGFKK